MPTKEQREQDSEIVKHEREALNTLIGEKVLHALGEPRDLIKVQVRQIGEHFCRVNVLVGVDAASVRVANSYFLTVDADGAIVASTPKITRQY